MHESFYCGHPILADFEPSIRDALIKNENSGTRDIFYYEHQNWINLESPVPESLIPNNSTWMEFLSEDLKNIDNQINPDIGGLSDQKVLTQQQSQPIIKSENSRRKRKNRFYEIKIIDITNLLHIKQKTVAMSLGISQAQLSKRWKKSNDNRKWPHRNFCKLNRKIELLEQQYNPSREILDELESLYILREKILAPATIVF